VTRAATQAPALASALVDAGAKVIELPVIAFADPADGGRALRVEAGCASTYDWIVLTSANAVERFAGALRDGRDLGGSRLAVVGEATARALQQHHLVADLVPEHETAEGLVAAMPDAPRAGRAPGRVLFPRAASARPVVAAGLRAKGWEVTEVEAYRTVTARAGVGENDLDAASHADVITFTSPSTVTGYVELAGSRRPAPVVVCIGPVTAEAARRAGFAVDVVAIEHSVDGLVAAVSARLGWRGTDTTAPA
jgi:uroporphyrinogen-III synthase